mgnify:CR=1 FL=1
MRFTLFWGTVLLICMTVAAVSDLHFSAARDMPATYSADASEIDSRGQYAACRNQLVRFGLCESFALTEIPAIILRDKD